MMVRISRVVSIYASVLFLLLAGCVVNPPDERVVVKVDNGPFIGVSRGSKDALDAFRSGATTTESNYQLGRPAQVSEITAWDVDIMPDGHGLPPGSGTVTAGAEVFAQQCAGCHGMNGEGVAMFDALSAKESSDKTIGSYWPFATTVFDYVRQAMPFTNPGSLTNDEVYALTAFLLHMNDIISVDDVMDAASLPRVVMPNAKGFILDNREGSNTIH